MGLATTTYVNRTIDRLYGIIEGIAIDYKIMDEEIIALRDWVESHEYLSGVEPFKGLICLLNDILEDGVIDPDEREDLLEWCSANINSLGFAECFTDIIRRLHGICSGIECDKKITEDEIRGLQDWLIDYEHLKSWWPINDLCSLVKKVLKDGKIDEQEEKEIKTFFQDFKEQIIHMPEIHDEEYFSDPNLASPSNIFEPVSSICEKNPEIIFDEKSFCFTGPAASGKRKDLFDMIKKLGGIPKKNPVDNLDYLIIGAQSSPAWVYSTYGRKIEKIMKQNSDPEKKSACIVQEYDFIKSAAEQGGNEILPDPYAPPF